MIKKTFLDKGIEYAGSLALLNVIDLLTILKWNVKNGIKFFRVSSDIMPWASHYELNILPQYNQIKDNLMIIGDFVKENKLRLTFHPGPYNVLTSPNISVVENTLADLKIHGEISDLLNLSRTPFNKINIHCNGVYGDKKTAMDRFCSNFMLLPESVRSRLTVENDDKASMYSVKDLMYIHDRIGIPIVFDFHHHKFCNGGMSEKDALALAVSTWPKSITPVVHYSESKSLHECDNKIKPQAHSDYINSIPEIYEYDLDVMVEAKAKELSIIPFLN
jgi:UV DNA damage endonuclease